MNLMRNRARLFEEMGIGPEWILRGREAPPDEILPIAPDSLPEETAPQAAKTVSAPPAGMQERAARQESRIASPENFADWEAFTNAIRNCTRCRLCETRTTAVPGVGDIRAGWLFIGEGPGYHEDQQGEPFVGRSGMLLDNMMAAIGIKRGDNAYIANIVKCRASDERKKDRPPTEEEAAACMPYLQWQIAQIRPKVIVALGRTAAVGLLNTGRDLTMAAMRGKVHRLPDGGDGIPLVVTYHPAYLLRTPMAKKQAWEDLCLAMEAIGQS